MLFHDQVGQLPLGSRRCWPVLTKSGSVVNSSRGITGAIQIHISASLFKTLKPFATCESFYCLLQTLLPGFFFFCADYPPNGLFPIRWRLRLKEAPGCFGFL